MVNAEVNARFVRSQLPPGGLFADQTWRIAPAPWRVEVSLAEQLEALGRVLLQFYRSANLLYRQSVAGKQPGWVAAWLDQGKPADLLALQRAPQFKNDIPRVIRPDILLTEDGFRITELDSVPGGIGLTAWLNQAYAEAAQVADAPLAEEPAAAEVALVAGQNGQNSPLPLIGSATSMIEGFASIFGDADRVHIIVSEEAATYRPEMEWLARQMPGANYHVRDAAYAEFRPGDAVYRFFELFDLANVPSAPRLFELATAKQIRLTPPPKPFLEEKLLFALLWNRNLREFWRRELGDAFFGQLLRQVPYTWVVDPTPLPPQGAIPELHLTSWHQLKQLSQRERELILKVSGFSDKAWGARGVYLGSDLSREAWSAAVDLAMAGFGRSPFVLQRYHKPRQVEACYFDFEQGAPVTMRGRARLCPYYFVSGDGDAARVRLGGVLATICPADKKIIHGMGEAVLAPCSAG